MTLKDTINKKFGKGSLVTLNDAPLDFPVYPTGIHNLDKKLGGGVPQGRVVEIYGPEGAGKSTLALHLVAETQANGGLCAYIDAEHALDPKYVKMLGVDDATLLINQPSNGEEALNIADDMIKSREVSLIVVDSVAALVPRAELAGEIGDSHVGLQPRMMGQALRMITGNLNDTNTTIVFINQIREKIGVMFGSPETTPGGRALKFYASQRLDVRRKEALKDGPDVVGARTKVKILKNKIAPPFQEVEFDIRYGLGVDKGAIVVDEAIEAGLLVAKGSWYNLVDPDTGEFEQIAQGKKNVIVEFKENQVFHDDLLKKLG